MKNILSSGIIAGSLGAGVVAVLEPLFGNGAKLLPCVAVSLGLIFPLGIGIGLSVIGLRSLLPTDNRPTQWLKILRSNDSPETSAHILTSGLLLLALIPIIYRTILFFLTSFHHHGLAALTLAFVILAIIIVALLLSRKAFTLLSRVLAAGPKFVQRPALSLAIIVTIWLIALAPPLIKGPEATGLFGFIGLLRKDGLGVAPLVAMLSVIFVATGSTWFLLQDKLRWQVPVAALCLAMGFAGPLWATSVISKYPDTLDRLDSAGGITQLLGKVTRKLGDSDGDGHARWMGGQDCNDKDPSIFPGAREVPDNGIDEDCSGTDLNLAALKKKIGEQHNSQQPLNLAQFIRPNLPEDVSLFLITIDSLRWDGVGFMGYERDTTPHLDKLVENGTIYDRAYALGSYTGQSVPAMMTGKYSSELRRNNKHEMRISGKEKFAAEYICNDNVRCSGVLSHFLFNSRHGWSQGFHDWKLAKLSPPGPGSRDQKYNSDSVADLAIKWLKDPENTSGRFFLWTHFIDPHKEYIKHKGIKSFGDDRRARYDHEVRFVDHHVGRMLDYFSTLPAFKRTIFIVSADHGEAFNEHGRWCHGKELWEEIIRVPLAVVGPGIDKKRISRQTGHIDIFPTLLDIFDVEIPDGIHGRSLLQDWVTGQELPTLPIIADQPRNPYYETRRIFIKDGWKLHDLPDTGTHRLYQITEDYERGDSLVKEQPEKFEQIKAAYDLFCATDFKPIPSVHFVGANVNDMPDPPGVSD